jgi:antitoxin component YwqK of YwqJK toxin-antitoxin module
MDLIYLENKLKCFKIHRECFRNWRHNNNVCINCKRKIELEQEFEYKSYYPNGVSRGCSFYENGIIKGELLYCLKFEFL